MSAGTRVHWPSGWQLTGDLPVQVEVQAHTQVPGQAWRTRGSSCFWEVIRRRQGSERPQLPTLHVHSQRERDLHASAAAERCARTQCRAARAPVQLGDGRSGPLSPGGPSWRQAMHAASAPSSLSTRAALCREQMKQQPRTGCLPAAQETGSAIYTSLVLTHPQDSNTHGTVYGGWLLQQALQAAQAAAELHTGASWHPGLAPLIRSTSLHCSSMAALFRLIASAVDTQLECCGHALGLI